MGVAEGGWGGEGCDEGVCVSWQEVAWREGEGVGCKEGVGEIST